MRFSEARGREVVSTTTAARVARLEGFVVAAGSPRVAALRLTDAGGGGSLLDWSDVIGFGADAVTVESAEQIHAPRDETEAGWLDGVGEVVGKRVLDERGDARGTISDVEFDPASGEIVSLITDRQEIPGPLLLGAGSYAVIVAVERSVESNLP